MADGESNEGEDEDAGERQRRPHDSAYKYLFSSRRVVHQFLTRFVDEQFTRGLTPDDVRRGSCIMEASDGRCRATFASL